MKKCVVLWTSRLLGMQIISTRPLKKEASSDPLAVSWLCYFSKYGKEPGWRPNKASAWIKSSFMSLLAECCYWSLWSCNFWSLPMKNGHLKGTVWNSEIAHVDRCFEATRVMHQIGAASWATHLWAAKYTLLTYNTALHDLLLLVFQETSVAL